MRIGHGYDIHKLVEGRKLIIGGVEISHPKGLLGHSDADVLIHAIIDAMLGAAGEGDIGKHFPDTDLKWKDANSTKLLECTRDIVFLSGFKVNNIDSTIIAEEPKLSPYIDKMKENISSILRISKSHINIKAKTNEEQDSVGNKNSICTFAVVTLDN